MASLLFARKSHLMSRLEESTTYECTKKDLDKVLNDHTNFFSNRIYEPVINMSEKNMNISKDGGINKRTTNTLYQDRQIHLSTSTTKVTLETISHTTKSYFEPVIYYNMYQNNANTMFYVLYLASCSMLCLTMGLAPK